MHPRKVTSDNMSRHRALEHAEKAHKLAQEGSYSPAIQEVVLAIRELCKRRHRPCTFEGTPTTSEYLRSLPVDECGLCSITQRLARDIANRLDELAHLKEHHKECKHWWMVPGNSAPLWDYQLIGIRGVVEVVEVIK